MKLMSIFLFVTFLTASAGSRAQKVSLKVHNVPLKEALKLLQPQIPYYFIWSDDVIKNTESVSASFENVPLTIALDFLLKKTSLKYSFEENFISFSQKPADKINGNSSLYKDVDSLIKITGTVNNENGHPIPGVTVENTRTKFSVVSSSDGRFSIPASVNDILRFTSVGYQSENVKVTSGNSPVRVSLKIVVSDMEDMVVVGYGSVRRKDLTGAVTSVDPNEIRNVPFVSIDQALAGKSTGVQVTQADGSPGGVAKIRIRGGSSLIGGNDPLYIIDGVQVTIQNRYVQSAADVINPIENLGRDRGYTQSTIGSSFARGLNTLAGLNINDIESIDILKDASATAIYGSRAASGVVIITTKKGKKNEKPILEANYYASVSRAITEKLLTAGQYKALMLEGARNVNALRASQGRPALAIATSIINDPTILGTANTNWLDHVTRTGIAHNADISVRGGGTGSRYYTSIAYNTQTGTLQGTDFNRLSGKLSLDNEITSKLRVITNLDYGFTTNNITNGIYSSALFAPPTLSPFNPDGSPAVLNPVSFGSNAHSGIQNPLLLLQGVNRSKNSLLLGALALEYEIIPSLKFRSTASVNYNNYHQLTYVPSTITVSSVAGGISSNGGIATQAQTRQTDVFYENTLTWDKQFNEDNRLNFLVGTSWQQSNAQVFSASGQGFPDDKFLNGLSSAALALPPKASESQSSLLSFYLRGNYALKERYLFTVTARSDASSKFPKDNRVSYFPSFGVAWRADQESFLKDAKWISELKFRASAGYTGTQNLGDNLFYTLYTPGSYGSTNALLPTQLGNERIKWEVTLQKDAGVDFALFNSRLRGAVGYYHKHTSDLLMAYAVATSSGFNTALVNLADMTNQGVEIDLRGDVIRSPDFTWNIATNISGNRSRVTRINRDIQNPLQAANLNAYDNSLSIGNTVLREGQPVGLIYGYQYDGVIKTKAELDAYKAANTFAGAGLLQNLAIGYPRYKVIETGPNKGSFKRDVIGNGEPKFYGGLNNTFRYRQFSLMALLTFSYGGELLYLADVKALGLGDRANRIAKILDDEHYSASNPTANRPALLLNETNTAPAGASDLSVYDASYLKLKSFTINYELPSSLLKKLNLRSAMIYAGGTNLFILTDYPGPDPEVTNDPYSLINGYTDAGTYPSMRQYNVGIRLGF